MWDWLINLWQNPFHSTIGVGLLMVPLWFAMESQVWVKPKWLEWLGKAIVVFVGIGLVHETEAWFLVALLTAHVGVIAWAVQRGHPWGALAVFVLPVTGDIGYLLYLAATRQFNDSPVPTGRVS